MTGHTVWLASYPKSGNTWVRAVLAAAAGGDPFDLVGLDPIAAARRRFDDALGVASSDLSATEAAALRTAADEVHDTDHDEPYLHKIHDALVDADGRLVVSRRVTQAAVYLVRDPRDVAVSFAHHNDRDSAWAVETMCRDAVVSGSSEALMAQLPQRLGTWSAHVSSWVDQQHFPVLSVRYEDCVADPVGQLGALFGFAGVGPEGDDLVQAVDAASFRRLQQREQQEGFQERHGRGPFFRRGQVGSWRDELPPDLAERLVEAHGPMMQRFGYLPA